MSSPSLYICGKISKKLSTNKLNTIKNICTEAGYILSPEPLPGEALLGNAEDLLFYIKHNKELIDENFIVMLQARENHKLTKHKEALRKLRFILGDPPLALLKIFIGQILQHQKKSSQTSKDLCSSFMHDGAIFHLANLKHSDERSSLHTRVVDFFLQKIEKFGDKFTASATTYAKNMGNILDELLMNAIWDANPAHTKRERTLPIPLSEKEKVTALYLFEHVNFVVSVSDPFGNFAEKAIEDIVFHALGTKETAELKKENFGAGLGLRMVLQKTGYLIFEIQKGVKTQATVIGRGTQSIRDMQKKPRTVLFFK